MKAQRSAVETKFANGTSRLSIYTPTGNLHATREFKTADTARRARIIARYEIGKVRANA